MRQDYDEDYIPRFEIYSMISGEAKETFLGLLRPTIKGNNLLLDFEFEGHTFDGHSKRLDRNTIKGSVNYSRNGTVYIIDYRANRPHEHSPWALKITIKRTEIPKSYLDDLVQVLGRREGQGQSLTIAELFDFF